MKIGITERGDAGIDFTWIDQIKSQKVEGAILITKNITDKFIENVMSLYTWFPQIIVHCTCTGWGNTKIEPNVPSYNDQLKQLDKLIRNGFPKNHCVLRVDPIFPTGKGIKRLSQVFDTAFEMGLLPDMRIRISVLDEYKHVKDRIREAGLQPIYGESFYAPKNMMNALIEALSKYNLQYECCAEPYLNGAQFVHTGCVSEKDIELMGLNTSDIPQIINPQNRTGCMCLSCKTELLKNRCRCPNKCVYCFWMD